MGSTYSKIYIHIIFSTKYRKPLIKPEFEQRLWAYFGGIARKNEMRSLAAGGISDHIHILLSVPPSIPVSKAVQLIKGGSSKWVNDRFFKDRVFKWQKGYGAFGVSESVVPATIRYINSQKKHHEKETFQEEFIAILDKHNISYGIEHIFD